MTYKLNLDCLAHALTWPPACGTTLKALGPLGDGAGRSRSLGLDLETAYLSLVLPNFCFLFASCEQATAPQPFCPSFSSNAPKYPESMSQN